MASPAVSAIFWLAWKEWWRAFYRAPADRDFLYLTLLLGLLIALGLAGVGFEQALLTEYADSLLGRMDPYGFPIVAVGDPGRLTHVDRNVIGAFGPDRARHSSGIRVPEAVAAYRLYPYKVTGTTLSIVHQTDKGDFDFDGWEVNRDDPLWIWSNRQVQNPPKSGTYSWDIVLNRHAFSRFDYRAYREALVSLIPAHVAAPTLLRHDNDPIDQLKIIWVVLGTQTTKQVLVPLHIVWVANIPAPVTINFLIPADIFELAEAINSTSLKFRPDVGEPGEIWVTGVTFTYKTPSGRDAIPGIVDSVAQCMGGAVLRRSKARIDFKRPIPDSWLRPCILATNSTDLVDSPPVLADKELHTIRPELAGDGYLELPCAVLSVSEGGANVGDPAVEHNKKICADRSQSEDPPLGWFDAFQTGYRGGMIYVSDRDRIHDIAQKLTEARDGTEPVFWLDSTYDAALNKVQYMSQVLTWAALPLHILASILGFYFIFVTLHMVIDHRKENYALLLVNGFSATAIRIILSIQIGLSCCVGGLVLGSLEEGAKLVINYWFSSQTEIAQLGKEVLGISEPGLFPPATVFLCVDLAVAVYAGSITILLLSTLRRLRSRASPIE